MTLDPHLRPPEVMKPLFKTWQKSSVAEIDQSDDILDVSKLTDTNPFVTRVESCLCRDSLEKACREIAPLAADVSLQPPSCYEINAAPGLLVYPKLLTSEVQIELLNKMLHRDLSNRAHSTNVHLHYEMPYDRLAQGSEPEGALSSFFTLPQDTLLQPKDRSVHKPLSMKQVLERRLRWITLGGQYNWTAKSYPSEKPPIFPTDVSRFLRGIWPDVDAQAGIVNFYTPSDTLSIHRDVSEECDRGLISISIGCDAIFIIGNNDGSQTASIRLRSGDALLMSGPSRHAWHAVPKILPGTCPVDLASWPATEQYSAYEDWQYWLRNKRINLNVRQMKP